MKMTKTILIVDDEKLIRQSLSFELKVCGKYSIITAGDVEDGWSKFEKYRPDLVITDFMMPNANGFELLIRIKNKNALIPVIVLTAFPDPMTAKEAFEFGADEFVVKPCNSEDLPTKVKNVLERSQQEKEIHRLKELSDLLSKENKRLKEELERVSQSKTGAWSEKEAEKYKVVCKEVAHDLKGEFLHIGYSLEEIRESNVSKETIEECDMIERSLAYSRLLMQRLLNFLDVGNLQQEPIELPELLKKTEALAKPRLPSNVKWQTNISPDIKKAKISANFEQLMAVLMELINNASKVTRKKGGTIEIKFEEMDNSALLSVTDDGPGIPPGLRNKILKEQVSSSNGGLGLGLYLCNKVILQFGGKLYVKTETGKGTTFTIFLPTIEEKKES